MNQSQAVNGLDDFAFANEFEELMTSPIGVNGNLYAEFRANAHAVAPDYLRVILLAEKSQGFGIISPKGSGDFFDNNREVVHD